MPDFPGGTVPMPPAPWTQSGIVSPEVAFFTSAALWSPSMRTSCALWGFFPAELSRVISIRPAFMVSGTETLDPSPCSVTFTASLAGFAEPEEDSSPEPHPVASPSAVIASTASVRWERMLPFWVVERPP